MVHCDDCHGEMVAGGPHGGSVDVTMAAGFKTDYTTVNLTVNSANGGMSSATVICAKCHALYTTAWSNTAHGDSNHQSASRGKCVQCHIAIPHAWKRPRLLRKSSDPLPYRTNSTTSMLSGMVLTNYTLSGSSVSVNSNNCNGCGKHSGTTSWP